MTNDPSKDVDDPQFDPKQGPKQEKNKPVGETRRKITKDQIDRAKKKD